MMLMLIGLQLLTLCVLVAAPIPNLLKLSLLVGLALQGVVSHGRQRAGSPHRPRSVHIDAEHRVRLVFADDRELTGRLRGDSVITPQGMLLRFKGCGGLSLPSLLLGPDSLSSEELRRLRILLRFGGVPEERPQ
jgi:hypothetical protein